MIKKKKLTRLTADKSLEFRYFLQAKLIALKNSSCFFLVESVTFSLRDD